MGYAAVMRGSDLLILAGLVLVIAGLAARFGLLSWFGNLPGDIRYEGERTTVHIPLTSMILVSLILSAALNGLLRLFRN